MKRNLTILFQIFLVAIGIAVLAFMLTVPHFEGRNVNATVFQVYFNDPFLAFAYIGSIPFFIGLYQAFKALKQLRGGLLNPASVAKASRIIKYCAVITIGFVIAAEIYIVTSINDDNAGGIAMGVFIILCSIAVIVAASILEAKSKKYLTA